MTVRRQFSRLWAALAVITVVGLATWISTGRPWALLALVTVLAFGIGAGELAARLRRS
jgi:hypothetical protein